MTLELIDKDLLDKLNYDDSGLIPAVVQDAYKGEVLMLAYMNRESLQKTFETGRTCFFSRSRQELWQKGETSGNYQEVKEIYYDCDADAILVKVSQKGHACHTGNYSCFSDRAGLQQGWNKESTPSEIIKELYEVIDARNRNRPEGSYTTYLFNEGQDKILKKVGEESTEVIIGSKNHDEEEIVYESGDFLYHWLVLMVYHGIDPDKVMQELRKRR